MSLVQVNWRPDRNELRKFGFISLAAFGALGVWIFFRQSIFGIELSREGAQMGAYLCWGLAVGSLAASLTVPEALRPLYVILTAISLPIGFVVSHVLMAVIFYGLLTPIAVFFRITGRDALKRRLEPSAKTYWQPRQAVHDKARYFKQF
jgi:Saxitoxin biosynthesis operon protein SxtJ